MDYIKEYICIKKCDNSTIEHNYSDKKIFNYEVGKVYTLYEFNGSDKYEIMALYEEDLGYPTYNGWISRIFLKDNFLSKEEYKVELKNVNNIFENLMN